MGNSAGTAAAASWSSRRGADDAPASSQVAITVISRKGTDHSRIAVTRANASLPRRPSIPAPPIGSTAAGSRRLASAHRRDGPSSSLPARRARGSGRTPSAFHLGFVAGTPGSVWSLAACGGSIELGGQYGRSAATPESSPRSARNLDVGEVSVLVGGLEGWDRCYPPQGRGWSVAARSATSGAGGRAGVGTRSQSVSDPSEPRCRRPFRVNGAELVGRWTPRTSCDEPSRGDGRAARARIAQHGEVVHAEHLARYQVAAQLAESRRVLDAACGEGYGTSLLVAAGAKSVVGIDSDARAVAHARRRYPGPDFIQGDVRQLPLERGAFDLVVSFETIEHVAEPEVVLDELGRRARR